MKKLILPAILFVCLAHNAWTQKAGDFSALRIAFANPTKERLQSKYSESKQNPNEVQALLSGLFLFYKSFISSQDQNRCNFHPSCSEFGLKAIKSFGIVRGGVCTFDRMARCNGLSPEWYEFDQEKRLLLDPVEW